MRYRVEIWYRYGFTSRLVQEKFSIIPDTPEQRGEFYSQF